MKGEKESVAFILKKVKKKKWSRELQATQPHFTSWENYQASPLGMYFWGHERG